MGHLSHKNTLNEVYAHVRKSQVKIPTLPQKAREGWGTRAGDRSGRALSRKGREDEAAARQLTGASLLL